MEPQTSLERRRLESLDAESLHQHQIARLNQLLDEILPKNRFYADKLAGIKRPIESLEELEDWPFTFKEELLCVTPGGDLANNLTYPLEKYSRFHQTSGTRGRPMVVLDTVEDWQWFQRCWHFILDAADVVPADRVLMAFSFGPFIGFWGGYDAFTTRGCLVVPGGGMSSLARLELARASRATVMCCTPSYALHMAEVAAEHQINVGELDVRRIIVAGEAGGSVRAVRGRIIDAWGATVCDHAGATEIGPWGYGDLNGDGLHILESEFIAEFLSVKSGTPAAEGELAEVVLTTLGRAGSPVIRYRTGDLVRPTWHRPGANRFVFLEGGVLGRVDDMLIIRGVNVFPTSVDQILRSFPEIVEYRLTAFKEAEMDQLRIEIEDRLGQPVRVANEFKLRLGLTIHVDAVPLGSLPRYEGKGRRFVDKR
ncbi:MAG TPA: phenylacetate--CoA ligase family protein [Pirellulales bacterium]|jgi:phenylacetate-CoA ligase|nr:phenylacetate--CoA ligase family protein [Pirellulales bacterium]